MHRAHLAGHASLRWRKGFRFLRAVPLAAIMVLALQAGAGDDRAVKSRVPPVYPEIAKRMHVTGEVRLEATVDAEGKVKNVKPVSGNHMLEMAAEDALRQWKFAPGDGDAVVEVSITFSLGN